MINKIYKLFCAIIICSVCIVFAYIIKPYRLNMTNDYDIIHEHSLYEFEKKLYNFRLFINYDSELYDHLMYLYLIRDGCDDNDCYFDIYNFLNIGLKNHSDKKVGHFLMILLSDDRFIKSNNQPERKKFENIFLNLRLDKDEVFKFICNYKNYNYNFAYGLSLKYSINMNTCSKEKT